MRRISLVLAAVFVLSVMVATAAPAMADDNWRGGHNWSWDKDHNKKNKKGKHHGNKHHNKCNNWNPSWRGASNWNWWDDCDWEWTPWGWIWDCD